MTQQELIEQFVHLVGILSAECISLQAKLTELQSRLDREAL